MSGEAPKAGSRYDTALLDEMDRLVTEAAASFLPAARPGSELGRYHALLREYPSRAGKGIRARLVLLATAAFGGDWRAALTVAAALETFQNWVLIHDDVEDDSDERRGRPTLHRMVGVPIAINVGDGLHAYMWEMLLSDQALPGAVHREFLWMIHRTAEGQHLDLAWVEEQRWDVDEAEYLEMVRLKTACYTVVSPLRLGAHIAGRTPDPRLVRAGELLGTAFQIRDDVLNLTPGAPSGKEFAGDLVEGKRTLILAHFFAHAPQAAAARVRELLSRARSREPGAPPLAILEQLRESGSLAYAQRVAEERVAEGLELLTLVLAEASDQEAAAALLGELESLASRKS